MSNAEVSSRIDLGLAIMETQASRNTTYSHRQIAAYCGCSHAAIQFIELEAQKKLYRRLKEIMRELP